MANREKESKELDVLVTQGKITVCKGEKRTLTKRGRGGSHEEESGGKNNRDGSHPGWPMNQWRKKERNNARKLLCPFKRSRK